MIMIVRNNIGEALSRSFEQLTGWPKVRLLFVATLAQDSRPGTLTTVMRLPHLPFVRALAALAITFATPGLELSHGLAHDHGQDTEQSQSLSHQTAPALHVEHPVPDHAHHSVSEALRIKADLSDFLTPPSGLDTEIAVAISTDRELPVPDAKLFGDRATGPPPRLRAPPID